MSYLLLIIGFFVFNLKNYQFNYLLRIENIERFRNSRDQIRFLKLEEIVDIFSTKCEWSEGINSSINTSELSSEFTNSFQFFWTNSSFDIIHYLRFKENFNLQFVDIHFSKIHKSIEILLKLESIWKRVINFIEYIKINLAEEILVISKSHKVVAVSISFLDVNSWIVREFFNLTN